MKYSEEKFNHLFSRQELSEKVGLFKGLNVAVIGDMVADNYIYGRTFRISREAPVLILKHQKSTVIPGGAANSAANLASLGANVQALGLLGEDAMGDALVKGLSAAGVSTEAMIRTSEYTSVSKTRVMAGASNTTSQQVVRIDSEPDPDLSDQLRQKLENQAKQVINEAQAVIISDYGYGVITPGVRELATKAALSGKPVIVDSRYNMLDFKGVTMLTPNEEELEMALKRRIKDIDSLYDMSSDVWESTGVKALLVTRGSHGMALMTKAGELLLIPVYGSDEISDVTGAGDTVAAAVTLGLCLGLEPSEAAKIANFSASVVVMKAGTAVVYPDELEKSILKQSICADSRLLKF